MLIMHGIFGARTTSISQSWRKRWPQISASRNLLSEHRLHNPKVERIAVLVFNADVVCVSRVREDITVQPYHVPLQAGNR